MCLRMSVARTLREEEEEEEVEWVGTYISYIPLIVVNMKLFDEDGVNVKAKYIFN